MTIPDPIPEDPVRPVVGRPVVLVGVQVPISDLVILLLKLVIASIPAGLLVGVVYLVLSVWLDSLS